MNRSTNKILLALLCAVGLFAWQVTIVLGGTADSTQYKNRVESQLGELHWFDRVSNLKIFKNSAYRNIQANSLSYIRAVVQRMTERFSQSSADISAINLSLEDASQMLREGRDLIIPRQDALSLDRVVAAYYGQDDMEALAALFDMYSLILQEADRFNAQTGADPEPVYIVPVASSGDGLSDPSLWQVKLPPRNQVEEEFLRERDRARKNGAFDYDQRVTALQKNSLFQVLHQIKLQEKTLLQGRNHANKTP